MTDRKRALVDLKVRNEGMMDRLSRRHQDCVDRMNDSKRDLSGSLRRHQETLRRIQNVKRMDFERGYKEWNKEETVSWILMIDDHRFSTVHKYSKFRKMLNKSGISGSTLHELKSELFLKYVKLGVASRTALIENINRLLRCELVRNPAHHSIPGLAPAAAAPRGERPQNDPQINQEEDGDTKMRVMDQMGHSIKMENDDQAEREKERDGNPMHDDGDMNVS